MNFGRIPQKDHSQADRLQFHCVCAHTHGHIGVCLHNIHDKLRTVYLGRKKEIIFTVIEKILLMLTGIRKPSLGNK